MNCNHKRPAHRALIFLAGALCLLAAPALVMLLWNALLPGLFAVPAVGYWQALGLLVLARLLLGFGMRPRCRPAAAGCHTESADAGPVAPEAR